MEIHSTPVKPSTRRAKATTSYKMKLSESANGHLIRVLIDQYSDGVAAVIREYASNARDAHIAAGKPEVPIEVTLPNDSNPSLKIRDHGLGLDEKGLATYVELGESTKRDSNEQTGAYGLGCKSGLTVAESFTVVSIHDGIKRFCIVGGDANGELALEVLKTVETDESNGVEVRIPFELNRHREVHEKAYKFFSFWEKGSVLVDGVEPRNWLDSVDKDNLHRCQYGEVAMKEHYSREIFVSMGNVTYPVELDTIASVLDIRYPGLMKATFGFRNSTSVLLKADIGSLDLVPARDSLNYTPRTAQNIVELFTKLHNQVASDIHDEIESAESFAEAEKKIDLAANVLFRSKENSHLNPTVAPLDNHVKFDSFRGHEYTVSVVGKTGDKAEFQKKMDTIKDQLRAGEIQKSDYDAMESRMHLHFYYNHAHGTVNMNTKGVLAKVDSKGLQHVKDQPIIISPTGYYGKEDRFKRTVIVFSPEDYPVRDLKLSSWRRKFTDWMNENDVDFAYVLAGSVDTSNPWVFDNDNVNIVDAADIDAEVKEIRKKIREANKAAGITRQKKVKAEPKYEFRGFGKYSIFDASLSELDEKITTLYYAEGVAESPRWNVIGLIQQIETAAAVIIKGNRSIETFLKNAEDLGIETIRISKFAQEQEHKARQNKKVATFIETRRRKNEVSQSYLFSTLLKKYEEDKSIGSLDILGTSVADLYDASIGSAKRAENALTEKDTAMLHMLDSLTVKEIEENAPKLLLPSREEINKKYPMMTLSYRVHSDSIRVIIDYIKLINSLEK